LEDSSRIVEITMEDKTLPNSSNDPFKITNGMIKLIGGIESSGFKRFRNRMVEGFRALHEDNEKIMILVQMIA